MYRREYIMSSRVDIMKWLGILQLIMGLLMFIISVVMVAIDLNKFVDTRNEDLFEEIFTVGETGTLTSMQIVWIVLPLTAIAVAAGASGSVMSRFEGLQYNISARNTLLALSTMNGILSMGYLVFGGMITFELADAGFLDDDRDWVKGVMAMMIVLFVLAFFDMFIAFICVFVCACWNPPTEPLDRHAPIGPVVSERIIQEKPYQPSRDYYRQRDVYSDSPYYGRSRTLPALKYY